MFSPVIILRAWRCPLCRSKPGDLQNEVHRELDPAVPVSQAVILFFQYTQCCSLLKAVLCMCDARATSTSQSTC